MKYEILKKSTCTIFKEFNFSGSLCHKFLSSTLKMEAPAFSEIKVTIYKNRKWQVVLYCGRVPAAKVPDALQAKAYCTNSGL